MTASRHRARALAVRAWRKMAKISWALPSASPVGRFDRQMTVSPSSERRAMNVEASRSPPENQVIGWSQKVPKTSPKAPCLCRARNACAAA